MQESLENTWYYQDQKEDEGEVYAGPDRREKSNNPKLPDQLNTLLDELDDRMNCRNRCVIPKEFPVHKACGIVAEVGDNNYHKGLENMRDVHNEKLLTGGNPP
jgi:hypothetical protein